MSGVGFPATSLPGPGPQHLVVLGFAGWGDTLHIVVVVGVV